MDFGPEDKIEVRSLPEKGRCLFSKVDIGEEDVIFEEYPIVSCQFSWNEEYSYLACNHCMSPLESVAENVSRLSQAVCPEIPYPELDPTDKSKHTVCDQCLVAYCSTDCKEKAWCIYHKNTCFKKQPGDLFYELNNKWKNVHYPPETGTVMLLPRIVASIEQAEDQEAMYNTFMSFCHSTVNEDEEQVHTMLGERYEDIISELYEYYSKAMANRQIIINKSPYTELFLTKDGFIKLLGMVGRNGQGIGTSVLAEWVKRVSNLQLPAEQKNSIDNLIGAIYCKVEEVAGTFLNNEGSGLYKLMSCANHSCNPNAQVKFVHNNHQLTLVALRNIAQGEEICISYMDECALRLRKSKRQEYLRQYYIFTCRCNRCVEEPMDADDSSEEDEDYEDTDSDNCDMSEN